VGRCAGDAWNLHYQSRRDNRGQNAGLTWTITDGHFGRTIEAVELEFYAMGRIGIGRPHPLQEFTLGLEPAGAVAESGLLHNFIRRRDATRIVLVHLARPGKTALDCDGAVAIGGWQHLWLECQSNLISQRSKMVYRFKSTRKCAMNHFIPDLKVGVFVAPCAP
jgi:hypothetical protein